MSKTSELSALHQLELALTHSELALEQLKISADIDDFPTARHEMEDLRDRCEKIKNDLRKLKDELDRKRSR